MADEAFEITAVAGPVDHAVLILRLVYLISTKYIWMAIVAVGLFGNTMSAIITLQKDNRRISTCNYMTALALADSTVLIELAWGMALLFWVTEPPSLFAMHMMWYQAYAFGIMSGFFLAEMTIDRLIVVRFPMAAPRLCTTRRAIATIVGTFVAIGGLNIYIFFTYKNVKKPAIGTSVVRMSVPHAPDLETFGNASQLAIGTLLPFFIIVFCNAWIIATLSKASKETIKMGISKKGQKTRQKETNILTRMLILVSIAYVLTSIPYRLYDIMIGLPGVIGQYNMAQEYRQLRFYSRHFFMTEVWEVNYAINFYLYCIGGGKKYRDDVKHRFRQAISCIYRGG